MSEEIHHPDGSLEHPDVRREETDASFRAILFILIGAAVVAVAIYVSITLFFYGWRGHETVVKKSSFPLAPAPSTDPRALPSLPAGEPRLEQVDRMAGVEKGNVYERLADKEAALRSYGSTEIKGYVQIPIERAMEIMATKDHKLPSRAKSQDEEKWRQEGLIDSGEPNSGREFRGKKK